MTDTVLRVVDAASFGLICRQIETLKQEYEAVLKENANLREILADMDPDFATDPKLVLLESEDDDNDN